MLQKRISIPMLAEAVTRVMEYARQGETEEVSLIKVTENSWRRCYFADHDVLILIALHTTDLRFEAEDTKEANAAVIHRFCLK